MKSKQDKVKDPVCGMWVEPAAHALEYMGMHLAFCSLQCKERFQANPHLYIGQPGQKAPKQAGAKVIKRRRFQLTEPLTDEMARRVAENIQSMMGIQAITIDVDTIEISYDLLQATASQIEDRLEAIGTELGKGWGQRLRRAFTHYLEEAEVDSLERAPSSYHGHHHH